MFMHRLTIATAIAGSLLAACAFAQRADDYPARAVRVIVPFAPGGPPDVIGRPLLQKLSEAFSQPFVFDNRPGASGSLGTELVAKSPRDGYTLLYTTGSHNTNTLLIRKLPYDGRRDFAPISQITLSYGQVLVVHPSLPAKTLPEFVALARASGCTAFRFSRRRQHHPSLGRNADRGGKDQAHTCTLQRRRPRAE